MHENLCCKISSLKEETSFIDVTVNAEGVCLFHSHVIPLTLLYNVACSSACNILLFTIFTAQTSSCSALHAESCPTIGLLTWTLHFCCFQARRQSSGDTRKVSTLRHYTIREQHGYISTNYIPPVNTRTIFRGVSSLTQNWPVCICSQFV